mmetsp:Transcript_15119/g.37380  ORF Transcript_15119/g.37380 Transcript_15119/m.37380 type:complete len:598 (+) Transcript_15119:80-1873(+)
MRASVVVLGLAVLAAAVRADVRDVRQSFVGDTFFATWQCPDERPTKEGQLRTCCQVDLAIGFCAVQRVATDTNTLGQTTGDGCTWREEIVDVPTAAPEYAQCKHCCRFGRALSIPEKPQLPAQPPPGTPDPCWPKNRVGAQGFCMATCSAGTRTLPADKFPIEVPCAAGQQCCFANELVQETGGTGGGKSGGDRKWSCSSTADDFAPGHCAAIDGCDTSGDDAQAVYNGVPGYPPPHAECAVCCHTNNLARVTKGPSSLTSAPAERPSGVVCASPTSGKVGVCSHGMTEDQNMCANGGVPEGKPDGSDVFYGCKRCCVTPGPQPFALGFGSVAFVTDLQGGDRCIANELRGKCEPAGCPPGSVDFLLPPGGDKLPDGKTLKERCGHCCIGAPGSNPPVGTTGGTTGGAGGHTGGGTGTTGGRGSTGGSGGSSGVTGGSGGGSGADDNGERRDANGLGGSGAGAGVPIWAWLGPLIAVVCCCVLIGLIALALVVTRRNRGGGGGGGAVSPARKRLEERKKQAQVAGSPSSFALAKALLDKEADAEKRRAAALAEKAARAADMQKPVLQRATTPKKSAPPPRDGDGGAAAASSSDGGEA